MQIKHLFIMRLVKKYYKMHGKDTIVVYLLMDKQAQEKVILWSDTVRIKYLNLIQIFKGIVP
jgi:hypothetical protein